MERKLPWDFFDEDQLLDYGDGPEPMVEEPLAADEAADEDEVDEMNLDDSLLSSPPPSEPAPSSTAVDSEPTSLELPSTISDMQTTPITEVDASPDVTSQQLSSPAVERAKPVSYFGYSNEWCYAGETVLREITDLTKYQRSQGAVGS